MQAKDTQLTFELKGHGNGTSGEKGIMKRIALALIVIVLMAGCKPRTPDNLPARIEIYGDAEQAILIDYRIRAHGETIESVRLPWRKDFTINVDDVISVFAMTDDPGTLRCSLTVVVGGRGQAVSTDIARGDGYKSVACGGRWVGFRYE